MVRLFYVKKVSFYYVWKHELRILGILEIVRLNAVIMPVLKVQPFLGGKSCKRLISIQVEFFYTFWSSFTMYFKRDLLSNIGGRKILHLIFDWIFLPNKTKMLSMKNVDLHRARRFNKTFHFLFMTFYWFYVYWNWNCRRIK